MAFSVRVDKLKNKMKRVCVLVLLLMLFFDRPVLAADPSDSVDGMEADASSSASKSDEERDDDENDENDEYSFKWLDPDKKVYVLQNRKFIKKGRGLVTLMGGTGFSNSFRNTYQVDPRIAYYFTETLGIEVFYSKMFNSKNNTSKLLEKASPNALPVVRELRALTGVLLHWSPWYAKINMFNTILYFDWYITGGLGSVSSQLDTNQIVGQPSQFVDHNFMCFFVGTGHQYYLSRTVIARLDLLGAIYRAEIFGNSGDKTWFSNFNLSAGVGLRF